jgi:hypothetical protein
MIAPCDGCRRRLRVMHVSGRCLAPLYPVHERSTLNSMKSRDQGLYAPTVSVASLVIGPMDDCASDSCFRQGMQPGVGNKRM